VQGTDGPQLIRFLLVLLVVVSVFCTVAVARAESGLASFYPGIGRSDEMTCAHKTRPLGSMVTSYGGRSIRCRVNDRGPFKKGRVIDVSTKAARALGMIEAGVVHVSLQEDNVPDEITRLVGPP
jgi:rare lipoprotein A